MRTRGVLKRVKCSPLSKITGERPVCQFCRKPLTPRTWYVEVLGLIEHAPDAEALAVLGQGPHPYPEAREAIKCGYDPLRVYRIEHRDAWHGDLRTRLSFWLGTYDGYGWGGEGKPPLFCSQPCGVHFGVACWHAGMRMKESPSVSVTSTPPSRNEDNRNDEDRVV